MLYKEWLNFWLENYAKSAVKMQTYDRYKRICSLHIIPGLGNVDLHNLSAMELQMFITNQLERGNLLTGKGLSASCVNLTISVLQSSLKTAYLAGGTPLYEADKIRRPKLKEKRVECFTLSEQKKLENHIFASPKDKLFGIVLCLYSGIRLGELLALTWNDIDFRSGTLSVSKTCFDANIDGRCRLTNEPKTTHSKRIIPLPKRILAILKEHKKRSKSEYVVSDNGKPIYLRSYQRTFELLLKKLNIPHKGFHALRHTFATRALECGMDVKTLADILGHKNPQITLNRYVHSLMDHKRMMMNKLGKLLQ